MDFSPLLPLVTCPHCWSSFPPEETLWVATHASLLDDPLLGPEQPTRFLPSRFDLDGNALDANGVLCRDLACPYCHLTVPRALLTTEPLFVSILGTPSSGKSFYLTSMVWELRRLLGSQFSLSFEDTDTQANLLLRESEERLFLNPSSDGPVPLCDLILKTQEQGDQYDVVLQGGQAVRYPRPFLFTVQPLASHPRHELMRQLSRVVCLYDNAGESFLSGKDTPNNPVTRHLAQSGALLFLFDPTQDQRFRPALEAAGQRPRSWQADRFSRQELVLLEAADRIRRYAQLGEFDRHRKPLVVIVTKRDVWEPLLPQASRDERFWISVRGGVAGLNLGLIRQQSDRLRQLCLQHVPEVVHTAERFWEQVLFVGVSALGGRPEPRPEGGPLAIRPRDICPVNVATPMLYSLARAAPGLIPAVRLKPKKRSNASA